MTAFSTIFTVVNIHTNNKILLKIINVMLNIYDLLHFVLILLKHFSGLVYYG